MILYFIWGIYLLIFKGIGFLVWLFLSIIISEIINYSDDAICQICEDGESEYICLDCDKALKRASEDIKAGRVSEYKFGDDSHN